MEWFNLRTSALHAPEYIGSHPLKRATWLNVSLWSAQQENGGRIVGAKGWKDRQWQQTCGVTLREVNAAAPLLAWDGNDLVIWNYPTDKEKVVREKRELARKGGLKSGASRAAKAQADTPPSPEPHIEANAEANASTEHEANARTEGEEEGNRNRKGNQNDVGQSASPSAPAAEELSLETADSQPAKRAPKMTDAEWIASLKASPAYQGIDIDREHAKATVWCQNRSKVLTRQRFINWLNRCDRPLAPGQNKPAANPFHRPEPTHEQYMANGGEWAP